MRPARRGTGGRRFLPGSGGSRWYIDGRQQQRVDEQGAGKRGVRREWSGKEGGL